MAALHVQVSIRIETATPSQAHDAASLPLKVGNVMSKSVGEWTAIDLSTLKSGLRMEMRLFQDEAVATASATVLEDNGNQAQDDDTPANEPVGQDNPLPDNDESLFEGESLAGHPADAELEQDEVSVGDGHSEERFLADMPQDVEALMRMRGHAARYGRLRNWDHVLPDVLRADAWAAAAIAAGGFEDGSDQSSPGENDDQGGSGSNGLEGSNDASLEYVAKETHMGEEMHIDDDMDDWM